MALKGPFFPGSAPMFSGLSTDLKPGAPLGTMFWETDTNKFYLCYDGSNWAVYNPGVSIPYILTGRNNTSQTNNWDAMHEEVNYTRFAPAGTSETVISATPCFFYGYVGITGVGTLTLRDSSTASASTSPLPASALAVGTIVRYPAIRFESGLTAQLGTGADVCTLFWRPIN
jgi:hypothetical protein